MHEKAWAREEYGHVELGDRRLKTRLVEMTAEVAERPAGMVTGVFGPGRGRQGAYRFLENPRVDPGAMERARNIACARRMAESGGITVVAVDQTSIQLSDRAQERDFGSVGSRTSGARGVQVMTALALDKEGAPLGVLHQEVFARSDTPGPARIPGHPSRKYEKDPRPPEEKESKYWPRILTAAWEVAAEHAPNAEPWFQCDRGADFWGTFLFAAQNSALVTVRMNYRHVVRDLEGTQWEMATWLKHRPVKYTMKLTLPAHDGRPRRTVRLSVRFARAWLALPTPEGRQWVLMSWVHVREARPKNKLKRISWTLATTYPVDTVQDAALVIENYTLRWRVEDYYRAWKSGACDIESSQLQSFDAFHRWSIVTSSMAARAEHIKHHSRLYPDVPATRVFSRSEINTMIAWRLENAPKAQPHFKLGDIPPLAEMVRIVAQLGGFMKARSAGPPGTVTLARGLERLQSLVEGAQLAKRLLRKGCD